MKLHLLSIIALNLKSSVPLAPDLWNWDLYAIKFFRIFINSINLLKYALRNKKYIHFKVETNDKP